MRLTLWSSTKVFLCRGWGSWPTVSLILVDPLAFKSWLKTIAFMLPVHLLLLSGSLHKLHLDRQLLLSALRSLWWISWWVSFRRGGTGIQVLSTEKAINRQRRLATKGTTPEPHFSPLAALQEHKDRFRSPADTPYIFQKLILCPLLGAYLNIPS